MKLDVEDYLAKVLPALLSDGARTSSGQRVIQMVVVDREECAYTYVIHGSDVRVERGVAELFDLGIALPEADLEAFSQNKLDVARALRSGRLKISGDETLLLWLADRLARARY